MVDKASMLTALQKNRRYDYSHFLNQTSPSLGNLLISRMLTGKGRAFVVKKIKAPIEIALVTSVRLFLKVFGPVTKEGTTKRSTHVLLDLRDEFAQHYILEDRKALLYSGWELLLFENEHDSHIEFLLNWVVRRLAEEREKGNWIDMKECPQEGCWKE